jgi:hypothetical protein
MRWIRHGGILRRISERKGIDERRQAIRWFPSYHHDNPDERRS